MKLAISNIAWTEEKDIDVYDLMKKYGFTGLEIAPTRIFPQAPYDDLESAYRWKEDLLHNTGFVVPSMQSIWFGRQEKLFGTETEKNILLEYTKKAIAFAESIGCTNLVFGCPKNRCVPEGRSADEAVDFFRELGEHAAAKNTVIGMEANPPIYNTNYMNTTMEAFALIEQVQSAGFKLNLDLGTMLENKEKAEWLEGKVGLINHVHVSEPGLKIIEKRHLHEEIAAILKGGSYAGYISIEMGKQDDLKNIEECMHYVKETFG
ncbi:MAG: sugar phosphate isomerase/epimerase [Lachnospiraceae bacterium]|nr:sugar phosphate isomerase/epimerase [Lachnospiraceae bacterium]MBQ7782276.1 sugar phosphate isomerase/epimerase [Lachnospiraceae bacterium]